MRNDLPKNGMQAGKVVSSPISFDRKEAGGKLIRKLRKWSQFDD
jgi:hypothetical protein